MLPTSHEEENCPPCGWGTTPQELTVSHFTARGKKVVSQVEAKLREQHRGIEGLKEEENFNCHKQ